MKMMSVITNSSQETVEFAQQYALNFKLGDVVLLEGDLGVGKTVFVQGVVSALGYRDKVLSPSFTLMYNYRCGKKNICHVDLYRIENTAQLETVGLDDYLYNPDTITFVEWGEKIEKQLVSFVKITFIYLSETKRKIKISRYDYEKQKIV